MIIKFLHIADCRMSILKYQLLNFYTIFKLFL